MRIGPLLSPPLTLFCLRLGGRLYQLNGLRQLLTNRSSADVGVWRFSGQGGGIRVVGEASCSIEHLVGAKYTDPDGERRWCHNAKVGDLTLTVFERVSEEWKPVQTLTTRGTCALEWVERHKDPRVTLWT